MAEHGRVAAEMLDGAVDAVKRLAPGLTKMPYPSPQRDAAIRVTLVAAYTAGWVACMKSAKEGQEQ